MNESRAFLFLSANTPWVYMLARSLADHGEVTAVRFYDWLNYLRIKPDWPDTDPRLRRVTCALPPGYAGRIEPLFRPFIQAFIMRESSRLKRITGAAPIVVAPYPYLATWVRCVPGEQLVYYNLDEYPLYNPHRAEHFLKLERELLNRARLTVCLSIHQTETLKERVPGAAQRVEHFPLGVADSFINPAPGEPADSHKVGYIGNLSNRVDWVLVSEVAQAMPDVDFEFIGSLDKLETGVSSVAWESKRESVFALPNVKYLGPVAQLEVPKYYWRYAVNWMPYDIKHPFNIASCPTKIMDALASGRPFVSTMIPEVMPLADHISIACKVDQMVEVLRSALEKTDHDSLDQVAYARANTWDARATRFVELLEGQGAQ